MDQLQHLVPLFTRSDFGLALDDNDQCPSAVENGFPGKPSLDFNLYDFFANRRATGYGRRQATYTSQQSVTLADTTTNATIYYTINGATPTVNSTKYNPNTPISGHGHYNHQSDRRCFQI